MCSDQEDLDKKSVQDIYTDQQTLAGSLLASVVGEKEYSFC